MTDAPPRPVRAALWMIGAIISFTGMAVAGRALAGTFSTFEIMTYRSAIGLMVMLIGLMAAGKLALIITQRPGVHLARNIAHFTGQNLWFYAVATVPLAQVFAIEFTSPLWVIFLAALFLGERLTLMKILAGVIGFLGVLIVLQPGSAPLELGHVSVALAAIGFAVTAIFTKKLTVTDDLWTILFWITAMQLVFGLICVFGLHGGLTWPQTTLEWRYLILVAGAGLTAHTCLTRALSLAPASVVMPLDFFRLPLIALIASSWYAEPLSPYVFLGAAMIFGANYANILSSRRRV